MAAVSHRASRGPGFIGALRRLRDPLLLVRRSRHVRASSSIVARLPATRGRSASTSAARSGSLPARCWTARPIYPEPTRDSDGRRQPGRLPAGRHPRVRAARAPARHGRAAWLWFCVLGAACSRRCGSSAFATGAATSSPLTSPVVVHGPLLREPHDRCSCSSSRSPGGTASVRGSPASRSGPRSRRSCSSGRWSSGCC